MASFTGLNQDAAQLQQRIEHFHSVRDEILKQVRDVIVGQEDVLDQMEFPVTVSPDMRPMDHGNAWSLYFRDPEGNIIELMEGYREAIESGGEPFVLMELHPELRRMALDSQF